MKIILLLSNFSSASNKAIEGFMRAYAHKFIDDHSFVLLNAWGQPQTGHSQMINLEEELQKNSEDDLEKQRTFLLNLFPFLKSRIKIASIKGELASVVKQISETENPELIVMGTKGAHVLRDMIVGTTSGRTVRMSKAPVLVIPEDFRFFVPERVVFATDMQECKNETEFRKLTDIIRKLMAQLLILHIYKHEKPEVENFEHCMKRHLEGIEYEFYYIQNIHVTEGIDEFSNNMKADFLAMIQHDSSLMAQLLKQSVTRRFTQKSNLPLLVIHD